MAMGLASLLWHPNRTLVFSLLFSQLLQQCHKQRKRHLFTTSWMYSILTLTCMFSADIGLIGLAVMASIKKRLDFDMLIDPILPIGPKSDP